LARYNIDNFFSQRSKTVKIPCAKRLPFIVAGLSFLQPALSNIQFNNLTLIATALVLGAKFNLTEISRMWLKEKAVSTLSYLLSDAKFYVPEMETLYVEQLQKMYKLPEGFYCIDDTMKHHTNFCKWIHGVFVLFDHAAKTNLKATCIVFLYYSDGFLIKFPITYRIYYKENGGMPWQHRKQKECKAKYDLALEMIEWALKKGLPKSIVLADSWFGTEPFIAGLKRLNLSYVIEVKRSYNVRIPCKETKVTPTGKKAKNQTETINLPAYFATIAFVSECGFDADPQSGKKEKVVYHTKSATIHLNSIPGKHRVIESKDPVKQTTKYLLTNELTWESAKIIVTYSNRWIIEEFFRNAKQLTDMEGATIRSEQGVTKALCLVSWIDSLLHFENYKQGTAGKLSKESLTIPSIVRRAQYENLKAVLAKIREDDNFIPMWLAVEEKNIKRKRKKYRELISFGDCQNENKKAAA
jgi:hypothetical protein